MSDGSFLGLAIWLRPLHIEIQTVNRIYIEREHQVDQTLHSPDPSQRVLPAGTTISHYRILSRLGAGGMGEVYLVEDTVLQRSVALKLLLPELCHQPELRKRFIREAQTVASLEHPNIVSIFEVAEHQNRPFFAMQYVDGRTLADLVRSTNLTITEILNISIAICQGLQSAHDRGIVHRDLKPGNIMIDHAQRVYLLDFGLAGMHEWEAGENTDDTVTKLTLAGIPVGTVAYMAPEQFRGHSATPQSDIFALGITLYELAAGVSPFSGNTMALRASSILRDEPTSLTEHNAAVPDDFARIVTRCVKKDPARRFQTVKDVCNELIDLKESLDRTASQSHRSSVLPVPTQTLAEQSFTLSAELVRQLSKRTPQMIGDRMTYLDNQRASDTLVLYLHGMGLDERSLTEVLRSVPYRAVAPSLYGFDLHAKHRIPLPLSDHSRLLLAFLRQLIGKVRPQHVLLVGVSSGADHFMHMLTDDRSLAQEIHGLLLMGCNLDVRTCFNSRVFAEFYAENPSDTLEAVKAIGASMTSLGHWLLVHAYLVQVMQKFGTNVDALRQYAGDIAQPILERGLDQFIEWYRLACETVPLTRFVFFADETEPLNDLLQRHLDSGVLGEHNIEKTLIRENLAHMELLYPEVITRHTIDMCRKIADGGL